MRVVISGIVGEEMASEAGREGEFRGVWFSDSLAVKRSRHRINEVTHQESLEFVPAIDGRHQIEILAIDRTQKSGNPVGFHAGRLW